MATYNPNESLTQNAMRGVDITEPETGLKVNVCEFCGKTFESPRKKRFCSDSCKQRNYYRSRREKKTCVVCGKELPYGSQKLCSDECRRIYHAEYSAKYLKERRKDEDFLAKTREWSLKSTKRGYAKRKWQEWLDHATAILQLAEQPNAQELIAAYLDNNLQERKGQVRRKYTAEGEVSAKEALESLGDLVSE